MSQDNETQSQNPVQASEPQAEPTPPSTAKKIKPWLVIFACVNILFFAYNMGARLSWRQETIRQVKKGVELTERERRLEVAEKELEKDQRVIEQLTAQIKLHADESEANRVKSEAALREVESSLARIKILERSLRR